MSSRSPEDLDAQLSQLLAELPHRLGPRPGFQDRLEARLVGQLPAALPWWRRLLQRLTLAAPGPARPARFVAVLLLLVALGGGGLATSRQAQAQVLRFACYLPGLGIASCDPEGLIALQFTSVTANGVTLTVTHLLSSDGQTTLQLEISGDDTALGQALRAATVTLQDDQGRRYTPTRPAAFRFLSSDLQHGMIYRLDAPLSTLASGARSVHVQLTAPAPVGTLSTSVPLVPMTEAGLPLAQLGGATQTLHGITVRVANSYADAQHTDVQLVVQAPAALGQIVGLAGCPCPQRAAGATGPITLLDDRGHVFYQERSTSMPPPATAKAAALTEDLTFSALPAGVGRAQLTIPFVVLHQAVGQARVTVPVAQVNQPIPLQRQLSLGPFTVLLTSVSLDAPGCGKDTPDGCAPLLQLHFRAGDWQNGRQLLLIQPTLIDGQVVTRWANGSTIGGDPADQTLQSLEVGVPLPAQHGPQVTITLQGQEDAVAGPWQLQVPIQPATPANRH